MAKYGNRAYLQLPRVIFSEEYNDVSREAKWLYVVLKELEHRYTDQNRDGSFFQSDRELAAFSQLGLTKTKEAKKELVVRGLIETRQQSVEAGGKKTGRHITAYRIK